MKQLPIIVFFFFFSLILFWEGLGLPLGHQAAWYILLFMPFFLFLSIMSIKQQVRIFLPRQLSVLLLGGFSVSVISLLLSVDKKQSFETFLGYIAFFLVFLFTHAYTKEIKKYLPYFILGFSFLFIWWYTVLTGSAFPVVTPESAYQFVYSLYTSHNHLGDFLMLPVFFYLTLIVRRRIKLYEYLLFGAFFCYFFFAFSRSAYVGLSITVIAYLFFSFKGKQPFSPPKIFLVSGTVLLCVLVFFSTTAGLGRFSPFSRFLVEKSNLSVKYLLSARLGYSKEVFLAFKHFPLFGSGPGTFSTISRAFAWQAGGEYTATSTNIFLDVLVGGGMIGLGIFFSLFWVLIRNVRRDLNFFWWLMILINFQSDYTFLIIGFFLLFVVLSGLIIHHGKEKTYNLSRLFQVLSVSVAFLASVVLLSSFLLWKQDFALSRTIYPLQKPAYMQLIKSEAAKTAQERDRDTVLMDFLFPYDTDIQMSIADMYHTLGDNGNALLHYLYAYRSDPSIDTQRIMDIYTLLKRDRGEQIAQKFMNQYLQNAANAERNHLLPSGTLSKVSRLCSKIYLYHCPYIFSD